MATVAEIQQEIARLQAEAAIYQSRIAALRQDLDRATPGARPRITQALGIQEQGLRDLQNQILSLQRQLATAQAAQPAPPPAQSAGQAVQADQQGGPLEITSPPSNIPPGYRGAVTNADGEVVAYVGANGEWEYVGDGAVEQAGVPISDAPQNETASDDAGQEGESTDPEVQQQLQEQGAQTAESKAGIYIFPKPNVLDNFATYTWSASLYIMTNQQFTAYCKNPVQNINSYLLLIQSGGAPTNQGGVRADQGTVEALKESGTGAAGRNPFFGDDYYIDNIEIKTLGTPQRGHGGMSIKFQITETENISLLDNLWKVVQDLNKSKGIKNLNYSSVFYLMVIRFYGYDANGLPIQIGGNNSDPSAAIEKYFPFQIRDIKFRVSSKLVTYDIEGVPLGHKAGLSVELGTIPNDIELNGETVGDLLTGKVEYSAVAAPETNPGAGTTAQQTSISEDEARDQEGSSQGAPPKATAAKSETSGARGGLISVMNDIAAKNAKEKKFKFTDTYKITFADGAEAIRDSRVVKAGVKINKSQVNMSTPASQDTKSASPDSQAVDTTTRKESVTAGSQVIAEIEKIIRQSEYIANQAGVKIDEVTGQVQPNPVVAAQKNVQPINWFYIETYAVPRDYDETRNDFAVEINYVIKPYRVTDFYSPYFNIPPFPGVHKSYPWWFTGQNTAVLNYEADFNKQYFFQVTGETTNQLQKSQETLIRSMRDMIRIQSASASGESRQGADGRGNEVSANAADYLYSSGSNATAKVRIIGDPAWIAQGEYTGKINRKGSKEPFLPDGTINFGEGHPLCEIVWQRPDVFDLQTGLQDPYARQEKATKTRDAIQSIVYRARTITSWFKGGKFEQELDLVYYSFPKPDGSNAIVQPGASQEAPAATSSGTNSREVGTADPNYQVPQSNGALPAPQTDTQPPSGDTGVDAGGNNVGILLRDETGQASTLRINPETGELYNATGLPAPPRAPSAAQQENQDALARYVKEIGAQDPESVNPIQAPNPPAPDVYGQVMNRET